MATTISIYDPIFMNSRMQKHGWNGWCQEWNFMVSEHMIPAHIGMFTQEYCKLMGETSSETQNVVQNGVQNEADNEDNEDEDKDSDGNSSCEQPIKAGKRPRDDNEDDSDDSDNKSESASAGTNEDEDESPISVKFVHSAPRPVAGKGPRPSVGGKGPRPSVGGKGPRPSVGGKGPRPSVGGKGPVYSSTLKSDRKLKRNCVDSNTDKMSIAEVRKKMPKGVSIMTYKRWIEIVKPDIVNDVGKFKIRIDKCRQNQKGPGYFYIYGDGTLVFVFDGPPPAVNCKGSLVMIAEPNNDNPDHIIYPSINTFANAYNIPCGNTGKKNGKEFFFGGSGKNIRWQDSELYHKYAAIIGENVKPYKPRTRVHKIVNIEMQQQLNNGSEENEENVADELFDSNEAQLF